MVNPEFTRAVEIKAKYLFEQYVDILSELFPGCATLPQFLEQFNQFRDYQNITTRKMDPVSIREKKISCSSAAALLALWWAQQHPSLAACVFLIEIPPSDVRSRSTAHVNVALPQTDQATQEEALEAFYNKSTSPKYVVGHYTTGLGLTIRATTPSYKVFPVSGVMEYLQNRVEVLGLPRMYSTKNGILAMKRGE